MKAYQKKSRPPYKRSKRSRNTVMRSRKKSFSPTRKKRTSFSKLKMTALLVLCAAMIVGICALMIAFFQNESIWISGEESSVSSTDSSTQEPQLNWEQTASLIPSSGGDVICENIRQRSEWNLVLVNPKVQLPESYLQNIKRICVGLSQIHQ